MPNKKDHCVDIQLSKGHPVKFLEFSSNFIGNLKFFLREQKKLTTILNVSTAHSSGNLYSKSKSGGSTSNYANYTQSTFYDVHKNNNNVNINLFKMNGLKPGMDF